MLNIFRTNKTFNIPLSKALKLKVALESALKEYDTKLIQTNSILVENTRDFNPSELVAKSDLASRQLIALQELLQATNLKCGKGERESNCVHIKQLSELQRKRNMLNQLDTADGFIVGGKGKIKKTAFLKKKDVEENVKVIDGQISNLQEKLSKFNTNTLIPLQRIEALKDIYNSVGID